jgi:hypothetical protein
MIRMNETSFPEEKETTGRFPDQAPAIADE